MRLRVRVVALVGGGTAGGGTGTPGGVRELRRGEGERRVRVLRLRLSEGKGSR
jgi:hypothetical protein